MSYYSCIDNYIVNLNPFNFSAGGELSRSITVSPASPVAIISTFLIVRQSTLYRLKPNQLSLVAFTNTPIPSEVSIVVPITCCR